MILPLTVIYEISISLMYKNLASTKPLSIVAPFYILIVVYVGSIL